MQEFNLKIDKGFLLSVYDVFASRQAVEKEVGTPLFVNKGKKSY